MKTLYLVDVSSLFFRSYYAISSHLISPQGLPTNALYGFLSMTTKFLRENSAEYLVYCFDHESPSFRCDIYPDYKANRDEMPEDLKQQIPYVKKLTTAMGITMIEMKGYEADDLIGSMATLGMKHKYKVIIISGDKDFAQLVNKDISMYDPMREKIYNIDTVQEKWGVFPHQMIDYLAIVGDSSDNIPGAFGIGPKGAQKLLQQYNTLDNIYKNLEALPAKISEKLKNSKENVFLSHKLARIVTDIKWDKSNLINKQTAVKKDNEDLFYLRRQPVNKKILTQLLKELGFAVKESYFVTSDKNSKPKPNKDTTNNSIENIKSQNISSKIKAPLKQVGNLKIHFFSLDDLREMIPAYSKVWIFSHQNQFFLSYKNKIISLENMSVEKIGRLLSEKSTKWHGYDLKSIWKKFFPVESQNNQYLKTHNSHGDTTTANQRQPHLVAGNCLMLAAYLAEPELPLGFRQLCLRHLDKEILDLSAGDLYRAHVNLWKMLKKKLTEQNMMDMYQKMELPLITVLFEMESRGIKLDIQELERQSLNINQRLKELEKEIFDYAKHEFNLASSQQLSDVLFKELGLSPLRKIKTGYSTDADVLNHLKEEHLIIPLILEYRELFKLKTTYVESLPTLVKGQPNRIHTHFRQAVTVTGRLSSAHPNLQNIPIRTERGRKIRRAFIADKNCVFIAADYSQIELRVLAHVTKDPALCAAFEQDLDIHQQVAAQIYGLQMKQVSASQRRLAKAVNFGLIYGQGAYTLSRSLGMSVEEAKTLIQSYFRKFKKVREYMEWIPEQAKKKGYVETVFGRRRSIQELKSARFHTKKFGERAAINMPIQGTAGDLVKMAMVELRNSLYSQILLQIHDELLFECPKEIMAVEIQYIKNIMENIVSWKVPLKVNISVGSNWESVKPI